MHIVLGSSSPRRKELVGRVFPTFTIAVPNVDETPLPGESPETFCLRASRDKAAALLPAMESGDYLLISGDTIVTIDGLILGKPSSYDDACAMLTRLCGRTHEVMTAVTLHSSIKGVQKEISEMETTRVTFKNLSHDDIIAYLSKIHYMDKAGSYAAQEFGEMIISSVDGSMTNVIGFPMGLFFTMLHTLGMKPGNFD